MSFTNRVAIVTGGAGGIGSAVCESLAKKGATVIVADINEKLGQETAERISDSGGNAVFIHTDVSNRDSVTELADQVRMQYGHIDVLVTCAAIVEEVPLSALTIEDMARTSRTNLNGVLYMAQAVIEDMAAQGYGKIVIVTSTAAIRGRALQTTYCMESGALTGFVANTACQYSPRGININAVACGIIDTDSPESLKTKPEYRDFRMEHTPKHRIGTPQDIAEVAVFLAGDGADFITGETITADGGLSIYTNGYGL